MNSIEVYNLGKQYRLGLTGTGTLSHDLNRWWYKVRGKEDPYLQIGAKNQRDVKSEDEYVWALRNINFEVKQGEILGIIGGNGAGKSTLLKVLSQVTGPTVGEFRAKGRISSLLEVGTGFHMELSGKDNIYLNGTILGMSKKEIDQKFDEIVQFSGVERYIDTPVKRYSSGMKVRLAFAVAAHLEPEILIVDEVLAVGDISFQEKAIGKMQQVSEDGDRTVLFVSHDMEAISRLCTRVMVLENGEVSFIGNTQDGILAYSSQMLEKATVTAIKDRKDRKGSGQIKFKDIWIENDKGDEMVMAHVGEPLTVCMLVETEIPEKRTASVGIGIRKKNGAEVCLLSSWTKGSLLKIDHKKTVRFKIPKVTLPEGDYIFDLFMENGTMGNVVQDHLHEAYHLKVFGKDFYKSGQVAEKYGYKVYMDFDQEVTDPVNVKN